MAKPCYCSGVLFSALPPKEELWSSRAGWVNPILAAGQKRVNIFPAGMDARVSGIGQVICSMSDDGSVWNPEVSHDLIGRAGCLSPSQVQNAEFSGRIHARKTGARSNARRHAQLKKKKIRLESFLDQNEDQGPKDTHQVDFGRCGTFGRLGNLRQASFSVRGVEVQSRNEPREAKAELAEVLSQMLPFVVVLTATSALAFPPSFTWFTKQYYAPALGGIMLSIGIKLSLSDFILAIRRPVPILLGLGLQYIVKPLLGTAIAIAFRIPAPYIAGFILSASVSGAQLSSFASSLGKADIALSIVLTSLGTLLSVGFTPLLSKLLIGAVVPVDALAMARSIMQVVILPIIIGLGLNAYAKPVVVRISPFMPLLAMVCTSLCIGSPLAFNQSRVVSVQGLQLILPVIIFHAASFAVGYWVSKYPLWRQNEASARTLSLCSGMQSSTLASLLATQFLGNSHAVPPSISVVVMSIMGLSLGAFWGRGNKLRDVFKATHSKDMHLAPSSM